MIGVPDDEWGESVKAFVVLKPGTTATEQEIIDTAKAHLASYQKPKSVEFVAELPKAPTGKILKRVLRDPYWADARAQRLMRIGYLIDTNKGAYEPAAPRS